MSDTFAEGLEQPELGSGDGTPETQPQPFEIPDDAFVSVKVNGEDKLLPWKEARSGVQLQSVFTQKAQTLAEERKQFERERSEFGTQKTGYDQRITQLTDVLKNPNQLMALYMHLQAQQGAGAPPAPQPLTTEAIPQLQKTLEERLEAQLGKYRTELTQERQAERINEQLETFMKGALAEHPLLAAIDGIDDTIYGRVAALKPTSLDEVKEHARTIVAVLSQKITKAYEEQSKTAALAKSNALRNGVESRGGQAVYTRPPNVKKLEDMDDAFLQFLQQNERSGA